MFGGGICQVKLIFRYIYGEFYEYYYSDYMEKSSTPDFTKIVEFNGNCHSVNLIGATSIEQITPSISSKIQGIIFVLNYDRKNAINYANVFFKDANEILGSNIVSVIAVVHEKSGINTSSFEDYEKLEDELNLKVFHVSIQTGENIDELFYYLLKKICKNEKKSSKRKKHKKKMIKKGKSSKNSLQSDNQISNLKK